MIPSRRLHFLFHFSAHFDFPLCSKGAKVLVQSIPALSVHSKRPEAITTAVQDEQALKFLQGAIDADPNFVEASNDAGRISSPINDCIRKP